MYILYIYDSALFPRTAESDNVKLLSDYKF